MVISDILDFGVLSGRVVWTVISSLCGLFRNTPRKCLRGQVVLITGSGNGLGRELALRFAKEHCLLVLWDIDEKSIENVAKEIHDSGGFAHAYVCDITDLQQVQEVGMRVQKEVGDVTILVNNAGILQNVLFTNLDLTKIKKTIEINLLSHFWINKFFLPRMMEMRKGHIVATASIAGLRGWLYLADYCASKFGIVGMMEALEEEIRMLGFADEIHFTTACPITINTGMNQNPTSRLPSILPILDVKETAAIIVDAVKSNDTLVTIPRSLLFRVHFARLFPKRVSQLVLDYLEYNMLPNQENNAPPSKSSRQDTFLVDDK